VVLLTERYDDEIPGQFAVSILTICNDGKDHMECWINGVMGNKKRKKRIFYFRSSLPIIPVFHYSTIPTRIPVGMFQTHST